MVWSSGKSAWLQAEIKPTRKFSRGIARAPLSITTSLYNRLAPPRMSGSVLAGADATNPHTAFESYELIDAFNYCGNVTAGSFMGPYAISLFGHITR
jgi:hypothetical protein